MNIILLTNEMSRNNGWATVSFYLERELRKAHKVTVITEEATGHRDYYSPYVLLTTFESLFRNIESADVVLCNVEPHLPLAALLSQKFNSKLVFVGHGTYAYFPFLKGWKGTYNRFFARFIDCIVVPSRFTKEKVFEWWRNDIIVNKWGVDTDLYHPVSARKEQAFISVGEQKSRKGTGQLILAFEKLLIEYEGSKLYLVGRTSQLYKEMVAGKRLERNIIFTGHVNHCELLKYLSKCICHVMPSLNMSYAFEGFGLVHLEANAAGLPSIGSKGTANEDVIEHGINGYLVNPLDALDLYRTMKGIVENIEDTKKLSKRSVYYAKQNTWQSNLKPFVELVEQLP